jgi:simple sugar transport system permease protein
VNLSDVINPPEKPRSASRRADLERVAVTVGSSIVAVVVALAISAVVLAVAGKDAGAAFQKMGDVLTNSDKLYETVWRSMPFILAAVAFAVTAKLGLFNIGVEGQFLMGMFWAAVIGAAVDMPAVIHLPFVIIVGSLAGGLWGGIAGYLKIKRGVNEVISTIMLNAIALQLIDWMFNEFFRYDDGTGSLDVRTKQLPESAWMGDIIDDKLNGFIIVVLLVCIIYYVLVFRSRFGFRLRASGLNAEAARTSGISANRMIFLAMGISGLIGGLAGLPYLLGEGHSYGPTRPSGYGFTGIGVALLGRNHPGGIIVAGLLFGFLEAAGGPLQLEGIPSSIVRVIQGIVLLSVVIISGAADRWYQRRTTEQAARDLEIAHAGAEGVPA